MTDTAPFTDQQHADIRQREQAATPGPWYQQPDYGPEFIASEVGGYERGIGTLDFGSGSQARADREFVIAARTDVPALLAEVDRLRAEQDRLLAFIERGFDTHMQFGVINPDGTTEMQPCADWCHACKLQHAEAERDAARRGREIATGRLLHFAAEAHRRKWAYDNGAEGPTPAAFAVLHQLGNEMRAAVDSLTATVPAPTA